MNGFVITHVVHSVPPSMRFAYSSATRGVIADKLLVSAEMVCGKAGGATDFGNQNAGRIAALEFRGEAGGEESLCGDQNGSMTTRGNT